MSSDVISSTLLEPGRLTAILRDGGALPPGRQVARCAVAPMDGGFLSQTSRVTLEYDGPAPHAPRTLVVKSPATDPLARAVATVLGMYEREVCFYRELAPRLPMRTPHCWSGEVEPGTGEFTLLVEDVTGATMFSQDDGCPPDEAMLAMTELAKLHAGTWDDPALAGMPWLNHFSASTVENWQDMFRAAWQGFTGQDAVALPPELTAVGTALGESDFMTWIRGYRGPFALTHADFHLSNLLFVGDGPGGPAMVTLDWQMAMHAAPLIDVAYFCGRMPTGSRRATERALVAGYHRGLVAGGVRRYPLEQCWADYQRWTWFGVFSAVAATMAYQSSPDDLGRYTGKVARYLTQALDHDAVRFLG